VLARLLRPSHYLKGVGAGQGVTGWLSPKMLYRMPRQQTSAGLRALGRLAFVDNYPLLLRRLETELRECCDPEWLQQAAEQTGLAVRATVPRVYLVTSLAGGTGSGMFIDLAYAVRHLLKKLGQEAAEVVGLFLVPGGDDHDPRRGPELANAFAALTELNHFAGPDAVFEARYCLETGAAPRLFREVGPPLHRCVLVPLPADKPGAERVASDDGTPPLSAATQAVLARTGHQLFADLATALGKTADQFRQQHALLRAAQIWPTRPSDTPATGMSYHTVGLHRLLWPRRQLLEQSARGLCKRLVKRWLSKDAKPLKEQVRNWVAQQWTEFGLNQEQLIGSLQQACRDTLGKAAEDVFADLALPVYKMLTPVKGKPPEASLALGAVVEAMEQFESLVGIPEECRAAPRPGEPMIHPPGSLEGVLREAAGKFGDRFEQRVSELVVRLIEAPEARLAGAEEAIRQLNALTEQALENHEQLSKELQERAAAVYQRLQGLLEQPAPTPSTGIKTPSWKAPFTRKLPAATSLIARELQELLRSYPKYRYQALVLQRVSGLYVALRGLLSDQLREVDFCRARLTELLGLFESGQHTAAARGQAAAGRWLFPTGCTSIDDAVRRLEDRVGPEQLLELDRHIQGLLRKQYRALVHVCMSPGNVLRMLMPAMLHETAAYLGSHLEDTNVAEVYLRQYGARQEEGKYVLTPQLQQDLQAAYGKAAPGLTGATADGELCLLAVPPGACDQVFRQLAHQALPEAQWSVAPGGEEIVFYREQTHRSLSAIQQFGSLAQEAYQRLNALDHATPHARGDIAAWQPADTGDQASA
jgi:hypothetical protein